MPSVQFNLRKLRKAQIVGNAMRRWDDAWSPVTIKGEEKWCKLTMDILQKRRAFIKLEDILILRIMAGCKTFLEREYGRDSLQESESLIIQIVLLVFVFYCQCLIRSCRRKYSRINVWVNILKPLEAVKTNWNHQVMVTRMRMRMIVMMMVRIRIMNLWWLLKVWFSGWITSARSVLAFSIFLENFVISSLVLIWLTMDLPVIDGGAANVAEVKRAKPFQSD